MKIMFTAVSILRESNKIREEMKGQEMYLHNIFSCSNSSRTEFLSYKYFFCKKKKEYFTY